MDTGVFQKNLIIYIIKHCNPECNPQMLNAQLTVVNWALECKTPREDPLSLGVFYIYLLIKLTFWFSVLSPASFIT